MSKHTGRNPFSRLGRRALAWVLWSRSNAIMAAVAVLGVLVVFTATSMVVGMVNTRRATLAAAATSESVTSTPTTSTPAPSATPTSLLDLATARPTTTTTTASATVKVTPRPATVAPLSPSEQAAATFMTRFCRPQMKAAAWWAGVRPLFTSQARLAYVGTDPSMVPCKAVTGRPKAGMVMLETVIDVRVPTTAGVYVVSLTRAGGRWSVERAVPPAGQ